MKKLLLLLWLVVLPSAAMVFAHYWFDPSRGIDTSQAAAGRIRPGMTMTEAEQIIGGRPGDYRYPKDVRFQTIFGHRWPFIVRWTTYAGQIDVTDGYWGIQDPPPGAKIYQCSNNSESWSTADGIVDSVNWSTGDQPTTPSIPSDVILTRTLICFGLPLACYLNWYPRRAIPTQSNPT